MQKMKLDAAAVGAILTTKFWESDMTYRGDHCIAKRGKKGSWTLIFRPLTKRERKAEKKREQRNG